VQARLNGTARCLAGRQHLLHHADPVVWSAKTSEAKRNTVSSWRPARAEQVLDHRERALVVLDHPGEEQPVERRAPCLVDCLEFIDCQHAGHEHLVLHPLHQHLHGSRGGRRDGRPLVPEPRLHEHDLVRLPDDDALAEALQVGARPVRGSPLRDEDGLRGWWIMPFEVDVVFGVPERGDANGAGRWLGCAWRGGREDHLTTAVVTGREAGEAMEGRRDTGRTCNDVARQP
jgi:hypothetical protein